MSTAIAAHQRGEGVQLVTSVLILLPRKNKVLILELIDSAAHLENNIIFDGLI